MLSKSFSNLFGVVDDEEEARAYALEVLKENIPRSVPKMSDEIDRSQMPFLKRVFQPKTPSEREFQATLYTRLEAGYNIAVNCNGATGLVVVLQVDKGPGSKWNAIYPDRQIEANMRILEVNHITDCFEMIDELRASSEAVIRFRRPVTKRLLVMRDPGSKLGVTLLDFDATSVWVDQVMTSGAVSEWNEQNPLEKITTGTRILEVNGVKGNVHRMYEALRKEGVLELVVESHGPETANRKEPASEGWYPRPVSMKKLGL
ncbi:unnamed protein product [Durusdinium trenchii]|uniref:PDZ domain-containing protein n=1 Tax=Durusdinium trenchii TaxID=1381693 RepID=A0ABP0LLX0_9DINO